MHVKNISHHHIEDWYPFIVMSSCFLFGLCFETIFYYLILVSRMNFFKRVGEGVTEVIFRV